MDVFFQPAFYGNSNVRLDLLNLGCYSENSKWRFLTKGTNNEYARSNNVNSGYFQRKVNG
jgi:hypothetical protein